MSLASTSALFAKLSSDLVESPSARIPKNSAGLGNRHIAKQCRVQNRFLQNIRSVTSENTLPVRCSADPSFRSCKTECIPSPLTHQSGHPSESRSPYRRRRDPECV